MKKVLVIGDVIADVYRDCTFKKMCPDAPDVRAIIGHSHDVRPGGAANVAVNLAALSPDTSIHLIGDIDTVLGRRIKQLSRSRVNMDYCSMSEEPITKERILLDGEMLLRVDNTAQVLTIVSEDIECNLRDYLANNDPDLIVVSDYGAGSINQAAWQMILACRDRVLVDTKISDLSFFHTNGWRTKLIKLNQDEWQTANEFEAAPERFFQSMVVTRGSEGAIMATRLDDGSNRSVTHTLRVAAHPVDVVDVCGCGDTFMAGLAASLLRSDDPFTAVQFANAAAATVVSKPRTSVADLELTLGLLGRSE